MRPAGPSTVLYAVWAPFFSGAERALLILLENLDPARYRPVVAIGTRGDLEGELASRRIRTVHIPITYSGLRTLPNWLAQVGRLVWLARRERTAIFHANDMPSFQPAGYAARLLGRPVIAHARFPDSKAGFEWFLKPGFARALFVSSYLRDAAVETAPALFASRSDVVHDGVRLPALPSDDERRAIRRELGLPTDATIIALTGQIAEVKGIWEFIDAAHTLVSRGAQAEFVVLGDDLKGQGALRRHAEQVVAEKGLASRVRFLGFRHDAPRLIPAFDVIAVPSHVEPLGNATLEGMAAGLPVVGSRVGGIPEMIVEHETGLLVPARDAAALAEALEALVRDATKRRALGRAGRERARVHFSPAAHAERVQAIYDSVLMAPPTR